MSGLIIPIAAEYTGKAAFKQAQKNIDTLERSVKKLAGAFGIGLTTAAVVAFGKSTVKAFAEDEKAAAQLANTLDNLGLAFANPQIASFIENLSRSASISDDQLRPAFQKLIQVTGSLTASQEMLNQAISISRATGIDLATVSGDLAQAYVGNTKGLRKYNLGLTQAELKASSFADIQERLTKLFSGANAKYLETYAGKMEALSVAAGEAKETIGKGLMDALANLSGDQSAATFASDMQAAADAVANISVGFSKILAQTPGLNKIFNEKVSSDTRIEFFVRAIPLIGDYLSLLNKSGSKKQSTGFSFFGSPMETLQKQRNAAAAKAAEAAAAKRAKELAAAQTKNTKALKDQAALKKAGSIFDLKQIQIIAALKGQISEEDRTRLKLQLALETSNVEEATRLTLQLAKSQGLTTDLAKTLASLPAANNPFAAWKGYLDEIELQAKRAAAFGTGANVKSFTPTDTAGLAPEMAALVGGIDQSTLDALSAADEAQRVLDSIDAFLAQFNASTAGKVVNKIEVTLDGKVVAESVQNQNNSGNYTGFSRLGDFRTL